MAIHTRINASEITEKVSQLCMDANFNLNEDVLAALRDSYEAEVSPVSKVVFAELLENAKIARECQMPLCQDTGVAVVFVEIGEDIEIVSGRLCDAINKGVHEGYKKGFLRKSMVKDPLNRINTGDNTPAIIHTEFTAENHLKITFMAKGGGCENMSRLAMLTPADGKEGVINFVVETVKIAKATIGKGNRSEAVIEALKQYKAVYFAATGGAAALLAKSLKKAEIVAYEDLGAEAIMRLEVENFPVVVANDIYGNDLFREGVAKYERK